MNRLCMGCMKEYDDQFDVCPHCGYAFNTPPEQSYHIPPGSVLRQRYIVGKVLGFGGFGITYVGWDYVMERKVAIKEYLPSEFATRMPTQLKVTVYSGDREEQYREGLVKTLDEARRLAKFEAVPGIVQIYDCFEANDTSYIIMEFLEGMSLKEYLEKNGKMTPEQALPVIQQVAFAMEEVHKTGILHRDIAPDNIYVLNPDEPDSLQVKLLDFGAARYATTKHSKSLSVIIKPGYAPEEQYRSRGDQGTWTDVYALAATFYKMLTGITPEDAMERSVRDEVKKPSRLGVKLSKPTETALMNALNVKIQDRTQTMEEFSKELTAAEVKERSITKDRRDVGAVPKWIFAVAGVGIAAVAVAAVLMMSGVIRFRMNTGQSSLEENMVRVPNVVNRDADEAETILSGEELGMSKDKMVFSEEIPSNMISYQGIKENTPVEKNTTVTVWISKGKETGTFPPVTGIQKEDALQQLKDKGFQNIQIQESMEKGIYNSVLAVNKAANANVALTDEIILTICMNEKNQKGIAGDLVEVPDLTGCSREELEARLEEVGLRSNPVDEISKEPEGTILRQNPAAGEMVNRASYVDVYISIGEKKIYMSQLELTTQAEAEEELEKLGLNVGTVTEAYSDTIEKGKVISQSIEYKKDVAKGTVVDLVISKGKDPAKQTTAAPKAEAATAARKDNQAAEAQRKAEEAAAASRAAEESRQAAEAQRRAAEAEEAQRKAAEEAAAASRAAETEAATTAAAPETTAPEPGEKELLNSI